MRTTRKMAAARAADLRQKVEDRRKELEAEAGPDWSQERQAESLDPVPGRAVIDEQVPGTDEQHIPGSLDQQFVPGMDPQEVPGRDEQHPPGKDEQQVPGAPAPDAAARLKSLEPLVREGWDHVSEERGARLRAWLKDR